MSQTIRVLGVALFGTLCVALAVARDFGPEWTRKGDYYHRTVEVPVSQYVTGNVGVYTIKLEHDEVRIGEIDGNAGFTLSSPRYAGLEVRKDNGAVSFLKVRLGKVQYYDLDADGILDTMSDLRGTDPRVFIFLDGQLIRIANSKLDGDVERARAFEGNQRFEFKEGKWQVSQLPK